MRIDLALFESQQSQRRGVVVLPSSLLQLLSPIRMLYVLPNRASFVPGRTWILALSSYRERVMPLELTEADPLPVFLHRGPDNHLGLYSRRNHRLATLLMYQALRREELVKVHVFVSPDDPSDIPRWQRDWQICRID